MFTWNFENNQVSLDETSELLFLFRLYLVISKVDILEFVHSKIEIHVSM